MASLDGSRRRLCRAGDRLRRARLVQCHCVRAWHRELRADGHARGIRRREADMKVVIVGAGVAGLAIGWRLREAGVEVTVLERAQPGHGATWAAAGMLSTIGENEGEHP